jgi:hypothetical protein
VSAPILTGVVNRKPILDALVAQLNTVANATGFTAEPVDPPVMNTQGHVAPYWVLHVGIGGPTSEQDLGESVIDLDVWLQVTCVGAFPDDVTALASRVDEALYRWIPSITGLVNGPLKPPTGFTPGPPLVDADVTPHRLFVPLQYAFTTTST